MRFRVILSFVILVLAICSAFVIEGAAHARPVVQSSAVVQLTGRQLAALLVPVGAMPRGYQLERNSPQDSGNRLETAPAKYELATMSCAAVYDDNGKAGFGESAFAEADYLQPGSDLAGTVLSQQVYQFRSERKAASFWGGLRAIVIRCPGLGLTTGPDHGKLTQHVIAVSYARYRAFEVDMSQTMAQSSIVDTIMLVVAAGNDVFTVGIISYNHPAMTNPSTRSLMNSLVARVQSAGSR